MIRLAARFAAAVALAGAALTAASVAEARPLTARDMHSMDRVGDPRVSPDGRWVAYTLRTTDWANNRGQTALWIADLRGTAQPRRLAVSEGGASSPRWGSDGALYFLSSRTGGKSQVYRTDAQGRAATQVTNLPLDVGSFRVSPTGRDLIVSLSVFPDCPTLACTVQRQTADANDGRSGRVYDRLFVRHWDTWSDGTRNQLWHVTPAARGPARDARPLMRGFDGDSPSVPFGDDADYAFTPDGQAVIFSAREAGRTEPWSTNFDLYRVSLTRTDPPENLTRTNPAWDAGPVFSPDGRWMAYRAMRRPGFEADRWQIMLRDLRTGESRELAPRWDRSADSLEWSRDGRTLYTTAGDVGQTRVFAINVSSGDVTPVTGPGHAAAVGATNDGFIYALDTLTSPADLYVQAGTGPARPLTRHNEQLLRQIDFGEFEQFRFRGWNNEIVHGYLVRPANYQEGRRYPVAFLIHGGPQGSFGNGWSYRWNPQAFAGAGYAVVMIDFHGSTGYGQAFTDSISGHWGDRPLEDLQKGWQHALRQYRFLDGRRACALGASYGGYMVNWIAGNWNEPWRCLVNHDGVFDQRHMGYSTEELWFTEWENGGTVYDRPQNYERFNPVRFVENWRVPMLVIHGARDYRISEDQGIAAFTALQRRGIPSRFLHFPDENHWVLKPNNSVQWYDTVLGWLNQWTAEENPGSPPPPVRR